MWRRFLRTRPWFRLTSTEDDRINGQVMADNGLELQILSGWSELKLKLSEKEAMYLLSWLTRTYRRTQNVPKTDNVIPIKPA